MNVLHKRCFLIWLILAVVWMGFVFYKSSQTYADQDLRPSFAAFITEETLQKYIPHIEFDYDGQHVTWKQPYDFVEYFIRKGAHVAEFALLCFLILKTLYATSLSAISAVAIGGIATFLYACSDEWHQSFVPGRTGHFQDVLVDSIGIVLVMAGFLLARKRRRKNE
ncbi:VanZ family protein [Paenibacillus sp. UMB4589-SE434]|uniref:VanZ family protein n=1 Tax=Paenibacillus sp. UMB4589-SE434 TaxID=3046314 RepID=UPI00254DFCB7|nr:VanZ family protein [Paenibacillus sp. UMB4589-SE434]MDK8183442.1 VanZ family protein [Paenibacillus sp. UMB4589-SE434]